MKIIAVVNNKGGVGKTTIARILAEYFSKIKNKRVLAIDMDSQANFSNRFIKMESDEYDREGKIPPIHPYYDANDPEDKDWDGRSSIAGIFFGDPVHPYPTSIKNLELLPAYSTKMLLAEAVTRDEVIEKVYDQLHKFLTLPELKENYDIVIIDTAPSKGPLTRSVVRAATDILIPSTMEPSPMEGTQGMMHLWKTESLRRDNSSPLNLIGIVANALDKRTSIHKDFYDDLKTRMPKHVLDSIITRRIVYTEVDSDGATPPSIFDYADSNPAKAEIIKVCKEIESKIEECVYE